MVLPQWGGWEPTELLKTEREPESPGQKCSPHMQALLSNRLGASRPCLPTRESPSQKPGLVEGTVRAARSEEIVGAEVCECQGKLLLVTQSLLSWKPLPQL